MARTIVLRASTSQPRIFTDFLQCNLQDFFYFLYRKTTLSFKLVNGHLCQIYCLHRQQYICCPSYRCRNYFWKSDNFMGISLTCLNGLVEIFFSVAPTFFALIKDTNKRAFSLPTGKKYIRETSVSGHYEGRITGPP